VQVSELIRVNDFGETNVLFSITGQWIGGDLAFFPLGGCHSEVSGVFCPGASNMEMLTQILNGRSPVISAFINFTV